MATTLEAFEVKMREAHMPEPAIRTFRHYYSLLTEGTTGLIHERDIEPLTDDNLTDYERTTAFSDAGHEAMNKAVVIKLNGGLGTSMGLDGPKCLLEARDGMTFLDIAIRQTQALRTLAGDRIPLILMNSFNTEEQSRAVLTRYENPSCGLPPSFLQHRFPKVMGEGLVPAQWPANPALEWNPPGHGDLYAAMHTSGMLERLLDAGKRYAFISNIDNLAAVLDPALLGYLVANSLPFMMEVVGRTPMHRKGGHPARLRDSGRLILREIAQTAPEDLDTFQDVERYRYFNTNNLWIDLQRLAALVEESNGVVKLPLIRNRKHLDPRDTSSPEVYQIETAMGAAVTLFAGAEAVAVPLRRYAPVKKSVDLLLIRSDRLHLSERCVLTPAEGTTERITVRLDERFYGKYDDLEARFPDGPPSLRDCEELLIEGDVLFGKGIKAKGRVRIRNLHADQRSIADGAQLTDTVEL
jgi:UTP--glucose-1-phosphate uridylyltransferase